LVVINSYFCICWGEKSLPQQEAGFDGKVFFSAYAAAAPTQRRGQVLKLPTAGGSGGHTRIKSILNQIQLGRFQESVFIASCCIGFDS